MRGSSGSPRGRCVRVWSSTMIQEPIAKLVWHVNTRAPHAPTALSVSPVTRLRTTGRLTLELICASVSTRSMTIAPTNNAYHASTHVPPAKQAPVTAYHVPTQRPTENSSPTHARVKSDSLTVTLTQFVKAANTHAKHAQTLQHATHATSPNIANTTPPTTCVTVSLDTSIIRQTARPVSSVMRVACHV